MRAVENRATFYIPVDKDGGQVAQEVAQQALEEFGGATLVPATGLWRRLDGSTEQESINMLIVHVPQEARLAFTNFVTRSVRHIGLTLDQEAVMVDVNGTVGIYDRDGNYA